MKRVKRSHSPSPLFSSSYNEAEMGRRRRRTLDIDIDFESEFVLPMSDDREEEEAEEEEEEEDSIRDYLTSAAKHCSGWASWKRTLKNHRPVLVSKML